MVVDLRLELLSGEQSVALRGALYGLLMLLPQTAAFHALRHRLQAAPSPQPALLPVTSTSKPAPIIDFDELLEHFQRVQAAHRVYRLSDRRYL